MINRTAEGWEAKNAGKKAIHVKSIVILSRADGEGPHSRRGNHTTTASAMLVAETLNKPTVIWVTC
jgi:hypothetical protein